MSLYRVHFTWNEKEVILKARNLDLTHPYFVSIKEIILPKKNQLIIDPSEDEVLKTFGEADHLMIPFQKVYLIEELKDSPEDDESKVTPFKLVETEDETDTDAPAEGKDKADKHPETDADKTQSKKPDIDNYRNT